MKFQLFLSVTLFSFCNGISLIASEHAAIESNSNKIFAAYITLYPELNEGCKLLGDNPSFNSFLNQKEDVSRKRSFSGNFAHVGIEQAERYITQSMQVTLVDMFLSGVKHDADRATVQDPKIAYVLHYYDKFMEPYHFKCMKPVIKKWKKNRKNMCVGLLYEAAFSDLLPIAQILLSHNVDPNSKLEQGNEDDTPLAAAVRNKSINMVTMLLQAKANPSVMVNLHYKRIEPDTLLHYTVDHNLVEIAQLLVSAGAFLHGFNHFHATPLLRAVQQDRLEIAKILIAAKADVNIGDTGSYYPIHFAVGKNNLNMVNLLLQAGADPNVQTAI